MLDHEREAPGELETIRRFVNSYDADTDEEQLATPDQARAWLTANGLPGSGETPSAAELERLVSVREALRALLLANNAGERPPAAAIATLNRESEEANVGLHFDGAGSALITRCGGVDAAIASLLAIVHAAMQEGTWERLKVCPADDCLWAFYDRSRNRSGTWCEMGDCGNRAKARAYRERHRAKDGKKAKQ
jgi:predicted RNA-binding Zn ribbon-like protein